MSLTCWSRWKVTEKFQHLGTYLAAPLIPLIMYCWNLTLLPLSTIAEQHPTLMCIMLLYNRPTCRYLGRNCWAPLLLLYHADIGGITAEAGPRKYNSRQNPATPLRTDQESAVAMAISIHNPGKWDNIPQKMHGHVTAANFRCYTRELDIWLSADLNKLWNLGLNLVAIEVTYLAVYKNKIPIGTNCSTCQTIHIG